MLHTSVADVVVLLGVSTLNLPVRIHTLVIILTVLRIRLVDAVSIHHPGCLFPIRFQTETRFTVVQAIFNVVLWVDAAVLPL